MDYISYLNEPAFVCADLILSVYAAYNNQSSCI